MKSKCSKSILTSHPLQGLGADENYRSTHTPSSGAGGLHLFITLLLIFSSLSSFSQVFSKPGAGVTIIVHGWNPDGSQPAWMDKMADAIIARAGGVGHIGTITVSGSSANLTATCSNWNFDVALANLGETVILVNWTAVSNHLTTFITAQSVAAVVAPKIYQSQNSQPALSELPIHLIGHSRGGGMIFEIARLLGLQGIEVEQVTALDPHPLTEADPQPLMGTHTLDTPVKVYENILFVDNYYQNIKFPTGQYISGAYNRLWTSLPGGYHNQSGYTYNIILANYDFSDHLNIILGYHGTIDLTTPVTNGQATMNTSERAWFNSYENAGENTGFKYSAMGMENRKSANIPVVGGESVVAGFSNNALLGGSGVRQSLTWTNAVWPNIITTSIFRNNAELQTAALTVAANEVVQLNYNYRSYANPCVVTFYIDMDRNPYNNNNVATIGTQNLLATGSALTQSTLNWTVSGLSDGTKYYICAKITDGIRTRFLYPNYEITYSTIHAGFENISDSNSICIYPNPTKGLLNIDVDNSMKPLSVKVFDLAGNLIIEKMIQNKGHTQLDMSNLKNAMYFIKADTSSQLKTCKLIKY
ncbi:MAG: T9SS type A sorting domain-containing protein [Paludibacter sp.]